VAVRAVADEVLAAVPVDAAGRAGIAVDAAAPGRIAVKGAISSRT
jgi:hypothetical protein